MTRRGALRTFLPIGAVAMVALGIWLIWPWGDTDTRPRYEGTARVQQVLFPPSTLHPDSVVLVMLHGPIPNLMDESMSMPFLVKSPAVVRGLKPGDRIHFTLLDTPDALLVIRAEKLPPDASP